MGYVKNPPIKVINAMGLLSFSQAVSELVRKQPDTNKEVFGTGRVALERHQPVENVVDLPPYISPEAQELSVDPVQDGLEEVPLPGVLAVEELQEL